MIFEKDKKGDVFMSTTLIKVCQKCGVLNSTAKELCESCGGELTEAMSSKRASTKSDIVRLENRINEKSANRNGLTKDETNMINSSYTPGTRRGHYLGLVQGTRREQRTLKRLQKRLERIKAKEEKASVHDN